MSWIERLLSRLSFVSIASIIALLVLAVYITHEIRSMRQATLLRELDPHADRVERLFSGILRNTAYQLGYIAKQARMNDVKAEEMHYLLSSFDHETSSELIANQFLWIDANDMAVSSNLSHYMQPHNIAIQGYIVQAKEHPFRIQVGKVRTMPEQKDGSAGAQKVLPVAMGVTDNKGHYKGMVLSFIPLREMTLKICNALRKPELEFLIFDEDFEVLLDSCKQSKLPSHPKLLSALHQVIGRAAKEGENRGASLLVWDNHALAYKISNRRHFSVVVAIAK
jgi:hypothetical protein